MMKEAMKTWARLMRHWLDGLVVIGLLTLMITGFGYAFGWVEHWQPAFALWLAGSWGYMIGKDSSRD